MKISDATPISHGVPLIPSNMTMYADVRYAGVVFPVIGWWLYDIFYITPFLAIPYLHTVNREIFSD